MTPEWKEIFFNNSEEHVLRVGRSLVFYFREGRNLRRLNSRLRTRIEALETRVELMQSLIAQEKRRQETLEKSVSELERLMQNLNL